MSKYSAEGTAWKKTRAQVLARDGAVCGYCGNEANTVDHVLPRSKGGADTMDNLISACGRCNGSKGNKIEKRLNWFNRAYLDRL